VLSVSSDCKLSVWVFNASSLAVVKTKVHEVFADVRDSIVSLVACPNDASWVVLVMKSNVQASNGSSLLNSSLYTHANRDGY
jgi:hypothetical protein